MFFTIVFYDKIIQSWEQSYKKEPRGIAMSPHWHLELEWQGEFVQQGLQCCVRAMRFEQNKVSQDSTNPGMAPRNELVWGHSSKTKIQGMDFKIFISLTISLNCNNHHKLHKML